MTCAAVAFDERVVFTLHGEATVDVVPHVRRSRRVPSDLLRRGLAEPAADPALREDLDALDALAGETLDEL